MDKSVLDTPLDDQELAKKIQKRAAKHILELLSRDIYDLTEDELVLRNSILRAMAPNMMPKAQVDNGIEEEEVVLSEDKKNELLKILES